MNIETVLFGVSLIPAIIGLIEVFKDLGMPSKAAPAAAVALGVLGSLAQFYAKDFAWIQYVITGISLGLSAVGLYSTAQNVGVKTVAQDLFPPTPAPAPVVAVEPVPAPTPPPAP